MRRLLFPLFLIMLFLVQVQSAHAQVLIAQWDFDDGDLTVDAGTGTATRGSLVTQDHISPDWLNSRWSTSSMPEDGRHVEFQVSTLGLSSLEFDYSGKRNNTTFGPASWALYYSTDGVNFTDATCGGALTTTSTPFNCSWAWNTPTGAAMGNQSTLYFRLYGYNANSTGAAGKFHIDDVTIRALTNPTAVTLQNTQSHTNNSTWGIILAILLLIPTMYILRKRTS